MGVVASGLYYLSLSSKRNDLSREVEKLKSQRAQLEAKYKKFLDEKKVLEERVKTIQGRIADIDKSKDILLGLKEHYSSFNSSLYTYTLKLPSDTWISSYKQIIDLQSGGVVVDMELSSLDAQSISRYGEAVKGISSKILVSNVERKVGQHGFEYYFAKLSLERSP